MNMCDVHRQPIRFAHITRLNYPVVISELLLCFCCTIVVMALPQEAL